MSSLNGFNGQQGRPAARPAAEQPQFGQKPAGPQHTPQHTPQHAPQQAAWPQPQDAGWPQPQGHYQPPPAQSPQQWAQPGHQPGYPQQGYGQPYPPAAPQNTGYGQQNPAAPIASGGLRSNPEAYAPSFEPFNPAAVPRTAPPAHAQQAAPVYQQHAAPQDYAVHGGYGAPDPRASVNYPQASHQWPAQQAANARGFDAGNYLQQPVASPAHHTNDQYASAHQQYRAAEPRQHDAEPAFSDWPPPQQHAPQAYDYGDAQGHHQHNAPDDMGFAQPAGGELEQEYAEEDGEDYEFEEEGRARRPLMIAAALAGAIFVGGGMAYGYKAFLGGATTGNPPMVKSASAPSKIKPADAGGKQFEHTDSKIMGRLGDGSSVATAAGSGELDANGTRKVSTLVVGRDGSIQAPPAAEVEQPAAAAAAPATDPAGNVSVPGMMVVDALGTGPRTAAAEVAATAKKLVVNPPPPAQKPVTIAKAAVAEVENALPASTGSIAPSAPVKPKPVIKKIATAPAVVNDAATSSAAASPPVTGGASGYVAVLASVPRSDSSRMDALRRFADMQQKYGGVLTGKTPDVAEANLGAKGNYHRLVVGPPASRQQAAALCSDLKAQGFTDCWVTSY
jgi:hypothetical protein